MKTLEQKALLIIESICLVAPKPSQEALDLIYKYAHTASGRCKHPHWEEELNAMYETMIIVKAL